MTGNDRNGTDKKVLLELEIVPLFAREREVDFKRCIFISLFVFTLANLVKYALTLYSSGFQNVGHVSPEAAIMN